VSDMQTETTQVEDAPDTIEELEVQEEMLSEQVEEIQALIDDVENCSFDAEFASELERAVNALSDIEADLSNQYDAVCEELRQVRRKLQEAEDEDEAEDEEEADAVVEAADAEDAEEAAQPRGEQS
jgi:uncharacterized membrane protein YccC